jgi:hypothetical protein
MVYCVFWVLCFGVRNALLRHQRRIAELNPNAAPKARIAYFLEGAVRWMYNKRFKLRAIC